MDLRLAPQPVTGRRFGGLALSVPLHLDRAVDRTWTRRGRWTKFSEVVNVLQWSDPDHGRAADLVKAYRDRNILQPICDYRIVTGPPRRERIITDHMVWVWSLTH